MPLFNLPKLLAKYEFKKHLPTGNFWWKEDAVESTGETGKLIEALTGSIGNWLGGIRDARLNMFITTADTDGLDQWGQDLQIDRMSMESDDSYRNRLLSEIIRKRGSKTAIESFVEDTTGFNCEVFQPWQFLHRKSVRDTSLGFGEIDPVNGRSGTTHRGSTYWQAGVIDIITDDYSPSVRLSTPDLIVASVKPYWTDWITPNIVTPDLSTTPITNEYSLEYSLYVAEWPGDNVLSGSGMPRSGRTTITNEYELNYSNPNGLAQSKLFDSPDFDGPCTIFDTAQTWDSLEPYTWDEACVKHSGVPGFDVLNKVQTVQFDVYDLRPILWDYSPEPTLSIFDTSYSWSSFDDDVTWDQATSSGFDGQAPVEVTLISSPLTYTLAPNGSFENIGGGNIPNNWGITVAASDATNSFRDIINTSLRPADAIFVTDGLKAAEFYVLCGPNAPSDNFYTLFATLPVSGHDFIAFDLTTGTVAQTTAYGTPVGASFGYVEVFITDNLGNQDMIWSTTAGGTSFRNVKIPIGGYQNGLDHVLTFRMGVKPGNVSNTYMYAVLDNVRFAD